MFKLDSIFFSFIFNSCKTLGNTFGYGAFEGAVIYLGLFTIAGIKGFSKASNNKKVVKK